MAAKRANFDEYLANVGAGTLVATNKPVQLHLEVSSRCNLRCKKCGFSWDPSLAASGRDLPWPILSRMDEFFAAAVEVHTFGYGEMFLYPELAPLVTVLKNHGCRLSGITNGVLIRPADVVWLVACGYDQLTFSIDGGDGRDDGQAPRGEPRKGPPRPASHPRREGAAQVRVSADRRELRGAERQLPRAAGPGAPARAARDLLHGSQSPPPLLRDGGRIRAVLRILSPQSGAARRVRGGGEPGARDHGIVGNHLPELRESGLRVGGGKADGGRRRGASQSQAAGGPDASGSDDGGGLERRFRAEHPGDRRDAGAAGRAGSRACRRPDGARAHVLPLPVDHSVPLGGREGPRVLLHERPRGPRRVHRRRERRFGLERPAASVRSRAHPRRARAPLLPRVRGAPDLRGACRGDASDPGRARARAARGSGSPNPKPPQRLRSLSPRRIPACCGGCSSAGAVRSATDPGRRPRISRARAARDCRRPA